MLRDGGANSITHDQRRLDAPGSPELGQRILKREESGRGATRSAAHIGQPHAGTSAASRTSRAPRGVHRLRFSREQKSDPRRRPPRCESPPISAKTRAQRGQAIGGNRHAMREMVAPRVGGKGQIRQRDLRCAIRGSRHTVAPVPVATARPWPKAQSRCEGRSISDGRALTMRRLF